MSNRSSLYLRALIREHVIDADRRRRSQVIQENLFSGMFDISSFGESISSEIESQINSVLRDVASESAKSGTILTPDDLVGRLIQLIPVAFREFKRLFGDRPEILWNDYIKILDEFNGSQGTKFDLEGEALTLPYDLIGKLTPQDFREYEKVTSIRDAVSELQKILGVSPVTGKWRKATEIAWEKYLDEKNPKLTGVSLQDLKDEWTLYAPRITSVNGTQKSYLGNAVGALQFARDIGKGLAGTQPKHVHHDHSHARQNSSTGFFDDSIMTAADFFGDVLPYGIAAGKEIFSKSDEPESVVIPGGDLPVTNLIKSRSKIKLSENQYDMIKLIEKMFIENGFTPMSVVGAVANAIEESSLDPKAIGDSGKSVGLFQLKSPGGAGEGMTVAERQDPVKNITRIMKVAKDTPEFMSHMRSYPDDPQILAASWCRYVEKPKDRLGGRFERAETVRKLLNLSVESPGISSV